MSLIKFNELKSKTVKLLKVGKINPCQVERTTGTFGIHKGLKVVQVRNPKGQTVWLVA